MLWPSSSCGFSDFNCLEHSSCFPSVWSQCFLVKFSIRFISDQFTLFGVSECIGTGSVVIVHVSNAAK
jgi:hypothetical protein